MFLRRSHMQQWLLLPIRDLHFALRSKPVTRQIEKPRDAGFLSV
jgi:hypothetical protein